MNNTKAQEVFDSFESSFRDKTIIPEELELLWLKKAVGRYSVELDEITFDAATLEFGCTLLQYTIDTLASFMREYYQEREVSRVNKQVSIVGKDFSIDGAGHTKTAARNELEYFNKNSSEMVENQKPTALS